MAQLSNVITVKSETPAKVEYYKLSPASFRYRRIMALARARNCSWREVVGLALDFYLEFQERRSTILTLN
jgi:hypothetical protein